MLDITESRCLAKLLLSTNVNHRQLEFDEPTENGLRIIPSPSPD